MLRVAETIDDLLDLRDWLHKQPITALDTETTGIDIYSSDFKVRLLQLGNTTEAWLVPFQPWIGFIQELFRTYAGKLLVHNASFDLQALAQHGVNIPWHMVDDTFIAMRVAEPHKRSGLKEVSARHVSRTAADGAVALRDAMRKNKWTWATVPLDLPAYQFYSALDVILLSRLWETDACREGVASPVYPMEMDVRAICTRMEARGMRIDRDLMGEQSAIFDGTMEELTADLDDRTDGANTRSNPEFSRWLQSQGVVITARTETGKPSVTRESLEELLTTGVPIHVQTVIAGALQLRKLQKIKSSYIDNFLEMSDADGFLHPSIETVAAKTGRSSIRQPALQTLPANNDDPDYRVIREAVIPREEGHKLVSCDYSQIELRAIAATSEDRLLIDAFLESDRSGSDFFTESMRTVYRDPTLMKTDRRRHGLKTLFYSYAYGAGIEKIARTAGRPVWEMQEIKDRVLAVYPGMKRAMNNLASVCKANEGWVTTLYGRRIYVDPEFSYKALNAHIQGSCADILKAHIVELANAGFEDHMIVPVHDEVLFSIPEEDLGEALPLIEKCMTDRSLEVPLLAEPAAGDRWADLK